MPGIRKLLAEIIQNENDLKKALDPNKQRKAERCDELDRLIRQIQLRVSKVGVILDDQGMYHVEVEYSVPKQSIAIDMDGNVIAGEQFKAINDLNLISYGDMVRIQHKIDEAVKKNRNIGAS